MERPRAAGGDPELTAERDWGQSQSFPIHFNPQRFEGRR
jgi:hypothetical protein